jgi:hypothetical protein
MPEYPDLAGLEAIVAEKAMATHRRRCRLCRHPEVLSAIERWRKARVKHPDKYAGLSWVDLLAWAGATKAGVDYHAFRRHYRAVDPQAWKEMQS